ncbi:hypothetical protein O6H91_05G057600 [Diphasiastrum complanatum]|uniref:Uncharacterized protein n=1 Tax=Diphasiastrum complanatum TaxID=34168 RepID=A0ACC2DNZ1_DIPCM|nr:hypothetical protein O6H91_05G057600 [Diphasiastrum complanatum]
MERSGTWFKFSAAFFCYLMIVSASLLFRAASVNSEYLIGVGSYDITGPAADVNMMGYAMSGQNAAGIHFRLRSRAFIIAEAATTSSEAKRIAYVNLDACMGSQAVTLSVLSRLKQRYGDLYNEQNVAISGIHTHSGPGGYLQYVIYIITALGFVRQSFDALVDGIETSIVQAHENLKPGAIYLNKDVLLHANINRSPNAYLNNPLAERNRYQYDVDKDMLLLKFVDGTGAAVGALNWFAVHGTSMNNSNLLISGDNKGAASRFMEDWFAKGQIKSSLIREGRAAEFTTMAGRRLREAITATLVEQGYSTNIEVVISGLTNTYSQYVTTFEEYQVQRYEGASTLYGPHTLSAYIQEMKRLAIALAGGSSVDPGPTPPYLVDQLVGFLPGVVVDSTPAGINFGDVKQDVPQNASYTAGDVVEAVFWSACPRNDLFTNATFSSVEQQSTNGNWIPVFDDEDWELRFLWSRPSSLSPQSFATIRWEIPTMAAPGIYRLRHFGAAKPLIGSSLNYFSGTSLTFTVS